MTTNSPEYSRKYYAKYKQTEFGKYSVKIKDMKRSAKFYYEPRNHDLTTEQFINLINTYNCCMTCGSHDELVPMLYNKLNYGGSITLSNVLSCCEKCRKDYYRRKVLTFNQWYKSYKYFSQDRYETILNHITKG